MTKKKKVDNVDKETGKVLPRVKNQANAERYPKNYEVNDEASLTKPNQSLSVAEMIKRHRSGRPIDGNTKDLYYSGGELLPDLSKMDLIDKHAYIDSVADHLVEVRARIDKAKQDSADKAKFEEFEKWHQEKLKTLAQDESNKNQQKT